MSTPAPTCLHWPSLLTGVAVMLAGTAYPLVFARADGHADHGLALLLFWAMSAGFIRGVGFIPTYRTWRWLFSGWACLAAVVLAGGLAAMQRF